MQWKAKVDLCWLLVISKCLWWASLVAQLVKNLSAMQETLVRFLGQEDPLEKGQATIPVFWPGEFHGLYSPQGRKESDATEQLSLSSAFDFCEIISSYVH